MKYWQSRVWFRVSRWHTLSWRTPYGGAINAVLGFWLLLEAASPEDILCMYEWFKGCAEIMGSE